MILLTHITIALLTLISSAIAFVSPSNRIVTITGISTFLTIASGSVLLLGDPTHLVRSCLFGLAIVTVSIGSILYAKKAIAIRIK